MNSCVTGLLTILALTYATGYGQAPQTITYQGLLTDNAGTVVADGDYSLTFRIFDAETGGTELWSETQPSVAVGGGLFKVQLGSVAPLTLDFDAPYWLEVQIGAESPQVPRIALSSVPYSFMAMQADQVDGFDANATPTAHNLLPLDATRKFPESAIPSVPPSGPAGGDLTGTYPDPAIAGNAVTAPKIAPDVVSSIDGVSNDAGDVDLVAGANVTITPDDAANTITIDSWGGAGDIEAVWAGYGLDGGGDQGEVTLNVNVPLELEGAAPAGIGVIKGTDTGSGNYGCLGAGDYGAYGYNSSSTCVGHVGGYYGVFGHNNTSGNWGYFGGSDYGAFGRSSNHNWGCLGGSGYGAYGTHGNGNHGSLGTIDHGVYGAHAAGSWGYMGGASRAVLGDEPSGNWGYLGSSGSGVYGCAATASDDAGFFWGDVYVQGSINKSACSFLIDHPLDPENRLLRHTSVESPEILLMYRGKVHLNGAGEGVVELPGYFEALTKEDEASIHLTAVGRPFLTGAEWNPGFRSFTVYGEANRGVFWEVLAARDDPVVRQLARPVEEEKGPGNKHCDRGRLLNPAAYGYPESMSRNYEELEMLERERRAHLERMHEEARGTE